MDNNFAQTSFTRKLRKLFGIPASYLCHNTYAHATFYAEFQARCCAGRCDTVYYLKYLGVYLDIVYIF